MTTVGTQEKPQAAGLPRRSFLKWSGAAGGGAVLVGAGASFGLLPGVGAANAARMSPADSGDKAVWNACLVNCGSRCALRLHVKDGTLVKVGTDDTGSDSLDGPQLRACVRGRSFRHRVYNPDRLKTPMRRKPGTKRGAGEWEEISWDEALDTIASEHARVVKEHGQEAVYLQYASGTAGGNITSGCWSRLLSLAGGYLGYYGSYSTSQITYAMPFTYGARIESNSIGDTVHSNLVIYWGDNPVETRMSGGGNMYNAQVAKKDFKTRTIVIDPRYSETALDLADQWIPIRPGTDAALVAACAHVLITEDLVDQEFLDTYCVGYDEEHMPEGIPAGSSYKSYILGKGPDGTVKTPEWASEITGIPVDVIIQLAREIGTAKPCAIMQGWGLQRQANGENNCRAVMMLPILTGNVGIHGGGNGSREGTIKFPLARMGLANPIKTKISCFMWTDAIERGAEMTEIADGVQGKPQLDGPIKMIINVAGNAMINQHSDTTRTAKLLEDDSLCELIVVVENHMTSSARYADILLPATTNAEEDDFIASEYSGDTAYAMIVDKAIEPLYDAKSHFDMCVELSRKMGLEEEFTEGRTLQEWRTELIARTKKDVPSLYSEQEFRDKGVFRLSNPDGTFVASKAFREDPVANPLTTPSGKIEIFSERLWERSKVWTFDGGKKGDKLTALPEHVPTWEGAEEALTNEKYPLQCIGHHYKGRTHSSYGSVDWLIEAHPQVVWMNTLDAQDRGIDNDDVVRVFNDRGVIQLPARVTPRIMPGVLSVPQGAWYSPDKDGVDTGGCINTLTDWHPSPLSKGNP
ncbi:molybdopterin-dependent oxidoreductase, partial [Cellulomonas cellasea]|uniref:DMSO/selenate family reductase complex A subunit n=1 Tax=Cellulomonas cellasea TaxID=43670 RepID=UPI0025A46C44